MSDQDQPHVEKNATAEESSPPVEAVAATPNEEAKEEEKQGDKPVEEVASSVSSNESLKEEPDEDASEEQAEESEENEEGEESESIEEENEDSAESADDEPLKVQKQILGRVRFRPAGEPCLVNTGGYALQPTQKVVVEIDRSLRLGHVLEVGSEAKGDTDNLPRVVRIANEKDERLEEQNKERSLDSFKQALAEIEKLNLPMKLIEVEYLHTGHKAIFYFSADGRVDFRQLVRNLAHQLRIRVEMRQIGIRDEAKIIGGIGPCGLQTCCSSWLTDFVPVSIKMAKEQNLSLKPQKVSGLCDRLMCCLSYESSHYRELQRGLPKIGKKADTWKGRGRLLEVNIARRTMRFDLEEGGTLICTVEDFRAFKDDPEHFTAPVESDDTQRIDEQLRHTPSLKEEAANGIAKSDGSSSKVQASGSSPDKRDGNKEAEASETKPKGRSRSRGRRRRKKPAGGKVNSNAPNQAAGGKESTSPDGEKNQDKPSRTSRSGGGGDKPKSGKSRRRRRRPSKPKTAKPKPDKPT